jgi:uncharacterized 2Fe-2S/4Fe-4S cluster protein (DUF4445 family)
MKHCEVIFKPDGQRISIHAGATLVEAAGQAGIVLNTACGQRGICGKCVVQLEPGGEKVLACQYRIADDITVTVPAESRFFEHKILSQGLEVRGKICPDVYRKYLAENSCGRILGVAVDIGTTTVVAKLIDMSNGECLATEAVINPQSRYGDDVISRIAYALTDEKLAELHNVIVDCIRELTAKLCRQAKTDAKQVYEICVVGNTTMNHLFLELPVSQLGQAPYKAFSVEAKDVSAGKLFPGINAAGNVHTVENITGFVGSDTVAAALATDVNLADEVTLLVDIGTNGEVVLGTKEKLYAASCAAGPAFEGARISCGSRAMDGAIEAVIVNVEDIDLDVIGNGKARSICGSGLIDAAAIMLDLGIIDTSGKFVERERLRKHLPPAIFSRVIGWNGRPAFVLAYGRKEGEPKVVLTQKDIRETQLAKAAIRAGIRLLQKKIGLEDSDIKHILLAGAFGNYIRRESALRIGLLPSVPIERIRFVGNAACSGAEMALLSSEARKSAGELARRIEYVEIAHEKEFETVFADSMLF